MVYRRGKIWWYKFTFAGRSFCESTKSRSKKLATDAERERRHGLEMGFHGIRKRSAPQTLKAASAAWLELKQPTLADSTFRIEKKGLDHLLPVLGDKFLGEIEPDDISRYQRARLKDGAAPATINMEVGTLRAILRRYRVWANIQPDVRMLRERDDVGKALEPAEEEILLNACADSRSRSLLPAIILALNTGMRYSELRLLTWERIDLTRLTVRVGQSKTAAGTGRVIPMNKNAVRVFTVWAERFPNRKPHHFVFPSEHYGAGGDDFTPTIRGVDPMTPIGSWKEAWESVKRKTGIKVRFHDLRHTAVTRMLEGGVPLSVVGSLLGWSPSTTALMSKRYGHIGSVAQREAVAVLEGGGRLNSVETPAPAHEEARPAEEAVNSPRKRRLRLAQQKAATISVSPPALE